MKSEPCLLYGVRDNAGRVHLTHLFLIDRGQTCAQVSYCGLKFTLDEPLMMPYLIRSAACPHCVGIAFPVARGAA